MLNQTRIYRYFNTQTRIKSEIFSMCDSCAEEEPVFDSTKLEKLNDKTDLVCSRCMGKLLSRKTVRESRK